MSNMIDMTGKRVNRWLVLSQGATRTRAAYWLCRCDCGTEKEVSGATLRQGKSHGCRRCVDYSSSTKHGHARHGKRSLAYVSWQKMRTRCYAITSDSYSRYGGRGITICSRWRKSFEAFLADMGERPSDMTLDRIDNNDNYEPSNCRWATRSEQQGNKRNTRLLTYKGRTMKLIEWAKQQEIHVNTLCYRLKAGWSTADAIMRPVRKQTTSPQGSMS